MPESPTSDPSGAVFHDALAPTETPALPPELVVEADGMSVFLDIVPVRGAPGPSLEAIEAALAERGVVFGIHRERLLQAAEAGYCRDLLVAQGRPATPGTATQFLSLLDDLREQSRVRDDDAVVDFRQLGNLLLVEPGAALMRRVPAQSGEPGTTVFGEPISPEALPDQPYADGLTGVQACADDPHLLRAAIAGVPMLQPRGVIVNPIVEVPEVDLASGDIDFDGALRVNGDIKAGMRVKVSGDIQVRGTVEAAQIEAGGNLTVAGGIVGGVPGGAGDAGRQARIQCAGAVQALFINHAQVSAAHDITVSREIVNSDVAAGGSVIVGGGAQGSIVGGTTRALVGVKAGTLGSMAGVPTLVQAGVNPHADSQRQAIFAERKRLSEERSKLEQLMLFFQRNPERATPDMTERVSLTHAKLSADLIELDEKEAALIEDLATRAGATIAAARRMWDGVSLGIGGRFRELLNDEAGATAYLADDEILFR